MDLQTIITLLNIDTPTLVVGGVLLVLAILSLLLSPFFKAVRPLQATDEADAADAVDDSSGRPGISILLTPHDNAEQLARNLEVYLGQDYPDFEVIVVMWRGDHETEDVLKRYANTQRLYTTYIPDSSRYMPREKLAVTLGVKAAKNEWLVLADIACRPDSSQWLSTLAEHAGKQINLVLTHTRYTPETSSFRRFERLYKELYQAKEIVGGRAYRANGGCLMFRKSEFMQGEGYRGNLKYLRGEYDFLVNKYARTDSVAFVLNPLGWLTEDEPSTKHWRNGQLFYCENRQHLEGGARHRGLYNLHQSLLHLTLWSQLLAIAFSAYTCHWLLLGWSVLCLLLFVVVRSVMAHGVFAAWSEPMSAFLFFKELRLIWFALGMKNRYRRSNKNDFISHKI